MSKEQAELRRWLEEVTDPELSAELLSIRNEEKEVHERFYRSLEFGTGGLRGELGAGTNRMNIYTVRQATQGFAVYLLTQEENRALPFPTTAATRVMFLRGKRHGYWPPTASRFICIPT